MAAPVGPLENPAQQDCQERLIERVWDGEHEANVVVDFVRMNVTPHPQTAPKVGKQPASLSDHTRGEL